MHGEMNRIRAAALTVLLAGVSFAAAFGVVLVIGAVVDGDAGEAQDGREPTATPTQTQTPGEATATATHTPTPAPPTPTPTSTTTPTQTPVPQPEGWGTFGQQLQAAVDGYWAEGRFAAAVTDLQTGYTVSANGTQHQLTGCVANLFILIATMQGVEAGEYPLETVSDLVDATIWSSNATTAYELYRIVGHGDVGAGVATVQAMWAALGMAESRIDHPPAYSGDGELAFAQAPDGASGAAIPDDSNNWTTALDLNRALLAFFRGELLSQGGTADLLARLTNVKAGLNYLVAYIPGEGTVSHKNGFFPQPEGTWVDNDVGIVRVERDGVSYAYAVSFFSDSVVGKYNDIALGQEISRLAYEYFAGVYGE
jgi:hypothetical protein